MRRISPLGLQISAVGPHCTDVLSPPLSCLYAWATQQPPILSGFGRLRISWWTSSEFCQLSAEVKALPSNTAIS